MTVNNDNGKTNITNAFNIFDNNFEKNINGGGNVASTASADLLNLKSAISSDSFELSPSQMSALEKDVDNLMGMIGKSGDGAQWQQAVTQLVGDINSFTGSDPSKVGEDAQNGGAYESSYAGTYSAMSTPNGSGAVSDSAVSSFAAAAGAAGVSGKLIATAESAVSSGDFTAFTEAAAQILSSDPNAGTDSVKTDLQQMLAAFTTVTTTAPSGVTTTAPSGVTTTAPSGVTTTAPSGVTTTAPSGVTTTAPSGVTTTAPSGVTTTSPTTIAPGDKVATNSTASTALDGFNKDFGGVRLSGDYASGTGNTNLQAQIDEAVAVGDKASFEIAKNEIEKSSGDTGIKDKLDTLESSVSWQPDGGKKVIQDGIGNFAGAISDHDWNTGNAAKDIATFSSDFAAGKSADVLQQDANQVDYDMSKGTDQTTALNQEMSQAIAYAQGGYKAGVDPSTVTISAAQSTNPGVTNDPIPSSNSFSQNDATMDTVKSFDSDFGGVRLNGNFASGKGNQMIQAELDSAVKSGDKTAFENLKNFIESATGDLGVQEKLNSIESSASWSADGGKASIATALSTAAGMMASGAWNGSGAQQDMQQFINDFIDGKDGGTLSTDAQNIVNDLAGKWHNADIPGYMQQVLQQAVAYADGGYKPGVDPGSVTVSKPSDDNS